MYKCKELCERPPKGIHRAANIRAQAGWLSADLRLLFTSSWIQRTVGKCSAPRSLGMIWSISSTNASLPIMESKNKGEAIFDLRTCPQDIAYPTDHVLRNKSREITEDIIDALHLKNDEGKKPRTWGVKSDLFLILLLPLILRQITVLTML